MIQKRKRRKVKKFNVCERKRRSSTDLNCLGAFRACVIVCLKREKNLALGGDWLNHFGLEHSKKIDEPPAFTKADCLSRKSSWPSTMIVM